MIWDPQGSASMASAALLKPWCCLFLALLCLSTSCCNSGACMILYLSLCPLCWLGGRINYYDPLADEGTVGTVGMAMQCFVDHHVSMCRSCMHHLNRAEVISHELRWYLDDIWRSTSAAKSRTGWTEEGGSTCPRERPTCSAKGRASWRRSWRSIAWRGRCMASYSWTVRRSWTSGSPSTLAVATPAEEVRKGVGSRLVYLRSVVGVRYRWVILFLILSQGTSAWWIMKEVILTRVFLRLVFLRRVLMIMIREARRGSQFTWWYCWVLFYFFGASDAVIILGKKVPMAWHMNE